MKYLAKISCVLELLVEIPIMLRLPKKPKLAIAKILLGDTEITVVPAEFEDLYKEQLKMYA